MKLGQPLQFIHTNVPGFADHVYTMVANGFERLKAEKPYWRSNWGLASRIALSPFEDQIEQAAAAAAATAAAAADVAPTSGNAAGAADASEALKPEHCGFSRLSGSTDGAVYVGAPRGPLHGGRFTRAAPRGTLHAGHSTGESQIVFILTCAQY